MIAVAGQTGCGKNMWLERYLLDLFPRRDEWVTIVLPHANPAKRLVMRLWEEFGEREVCERVIVERMEDMDLVIKRNYCLFSEDPDAWTRLMENDDLARATQDYAVRRRGDLKVIGDHPVLDTGTIWPIRAQQQLRQKGTWLPDAEIPFILEPGHPAWTLAVAHGDAEVKRYLLWVASLSMRDRISLILPPQRMLEGVFRDPAVRARSSSPCKWDLSGFMKNCGWHIIIGGGSVSKEGFRTAVGCDFMEKMRLMFKKIVKRKGIYICDEATNAKLLGNYEAECLATARDFKVTLFYLLQTLVFPNEEVEASVWQNCDMILGRVRDPDMAEKAAKAMMGMLDADKIHHYDESTRQVHDGYEELDKMTTSEHLNALGERSTSSQQGKQLVGKHRQETTKKAVYMPGKEQMLFNAGLLQEQQPGDFFVCEKGSKPYQVHVEMQPTPYGCDGDPDFFIEPYYKEKFEECLKIMKAKNPLYEAPVIFQYPAPPAGQPANNRPPKGRTQKLGGLPKPIP